MPSFFSKRNRSASASRPTTPASTSAQSAAAQAFLSNRTSQTHLSASAAAAALRSMTPPPTAVDQIQTKRMMNRQMSPSAPTNAPRGRAKGTVQRRSSSSSMTERTFRSPSPGRPSTSSGVETMRHDREYVPPVPTVPEDYSSVPPIPAKSHRRSISMDDFRQRTTNPPVGRGQSIDRANKPPPSTVQSIGTNRITIPEATSEMERSNSGNSYNFSYPRGSRPNSPPPRSPVVGEAPSLRNGISKQEADNIQYDLNQTAQQPVKKKKKKLDRELVQGSHLQTGTMGAKPVVTPLAPGPSASEAQASTVTEKPAKKKKKKAALTGQASHFPDSPTSPIADSAGSDSDTSVDRAREQRAKRASGLLAKQPSVVREDWEGEQEEEERSSPQEAKASIHFPSQPSSAQSRQKATEANMSRKIDEQTASAKSTYIVNTPQGVRNDSLTPSPVNGKGRASMDEGQEERSLSRSPSRSARFSNRLSSDITAAGRHNPPGRSVSPAKSALKQHSPSPQGASPVSAEFPRTVRDSSPSEATDVSTEGGTRRKKAVHVSFDTKPAAVGTAAEPATPDEPILVSPQDRDRSRKWVALKNRPLPYGVGASDEPTDEAMGHRPQLPTFGSVRKNRRDDTEEARNSAAPLVARQVSSRTSSTSSSSSSPTDPPTLDTSVSSDHAIGGLLSREAQVKNSRESTAPVPPQVTSVEGTGYHSDSDSDSSEDEAATADRTRHGKEGSSLPSAEFVEAQNAADVPVIAVQPATPGLEEAGKPTDQWLVDLPGGFPDSNNQSNEASESSTPAPGQSPSGLGIASSKSTTANGKQESISTQKTSDRSPSTTVDKGEDSSDDSNSVYSDAAEDASDFEGDGFGSIDAVVRSPILPSNSNLLSSPPDSPLAAIPEHEERPDSVNRTASWEQAQARWSQIATHAKQASLQPAAEISEKSQQTEPKKKKKKEKQQPEATQFYRDVTQESPPRNFLPPAVSSDSPVHAPNQSSAYPVIATRSSTAEKQSSFRRSMRLEPEPPSAPANKRWSMRSEPESTSSHAMRSSMRNNANEGNPQPRPKSMAMSTTNTVAQNTGPKLSTLKKQTLPAAADSDSESSFKKRRRSKKPVDGKYTMKRSMRATTPAVTQPAGRGAVRSLSPVQRRPLSPTGGQSTMRTTLRGSIDSTAPTLRGQPQAKRPSSLFGFGSRDKSPLRPASTVLSTSKFKSRVADSDDEDGPRPTVFQSRFADSSDEEDEPTSLRPVRGIPRKTDDGDSTDLDDSSDDDGKKTHKAPGTQKNAQPTSASLANNVDTGSALSTPTKKKRGFFGRLRKNKGDTSHANSSQMFSPPQTSAAAPSGMEAGDVAASELGFRSEAEKEALIEQTRKRLEELKARPTSPISPTGKLQRRMTPQRVMSDTWPLPPKIPATDDERPSTSDAVPNGATATRPDIGVRQPTQETVSTSAGTGAYGRTGKKKRFPLLRKAFGLKD